MYINIVEHFFRKFGTVAARDWKSGEIHLRQVDVKMRKGSPLCERLKNKV